MPPTAACRLAGARVVARVRRVVARVRRTNVRTLYLGICSGDFTGILLVFALVCRHCNPRRRLPARDFPGAWPM